MRKCFCDKCGKETKILTYVSSISRIELCENCDGKWIEIVKKQKLAYEDALQQFMKLVDRVDTK